MRFEHFSTESYPLQQRPDAWRERLQQHHLRPEGSVDPASMFDTLVAGRTLRGVELARIASSPQTLARLSVAVDFGVTQVVDGNWGVQAVTRKALFTDAG